MYKNENIKGKCQIFTPEDYVKELLDTVGYNQDILKKTILENSCGDGNILKVIVERYIDSALFSKYSSEQIQKELSEYIYGFEIDKTQYEKCIANLNEVIASYGISDVQWKIFNEDYLKNENNIKFDFIVGNPPYVQYAELSIEEREYIKKNYETCVNGKFDYCYAFIEKSIKSLKKNGKMSYLIPSSIFKTVFGNKLREFLKEDIYQIKDYTQEKIFKNALVKSAIIHIDKELSNKEVYYLDKSTDTGFFINKKNMGNKWFFSREFHNGTKRFGDYFKVSHVVATLLNKAFVIKEEDYIEDSEYYIVDGIKIEKNVVRDTATPRTIRYNKKEKIIFPYTYVNEELVRFNEKEFKEYYPGTISHFEKFKSELSKRKADSKAIWFEYGRSQALSDINRKKLLISTILTGKTSIYMLDKEVIPYGGMYIISRDINKKYNLEFAKKILESEMFLKYAKKVGINISGNSIRITSKDIENYKF